MAEYKLTREEIETNINFCSADDFATVYTCSKIMMRKLDALVESRPDDVKIIAEDRFSKTYTLPKKWVMRISAPRVMTEEQREAARQRLLKYRENLKKANVEEDEALSEEDFDEV